MKPLIFRLVFCVVILLTLTTRTSAREALLNIAPGWNLTSGYLRVAGFSSIYFKNEMIRKADEVKRTESFRHIQSGFRVSYAFSPRLEIEYKQYLYQDHHLDQPAYNFPDDALLKFKYAALKPLGNNLRFGLSFSSRLPFAKKRNGIMEPFTANRVTLAFAGHLSYAPDLLLPENVFNMHFNLGYVNYTNTGEEITNTFGETEEALTPTQAVQYGAALVFPSNSFTLSFELFGQAFIEQPPETAWGRENFLYFSPAVTFPLFLKLNLRLGADLRMSSNQNFDFTTEKDGLSSTFKLGAYPSWRITAGLNFEIPLRKPARLKQIEPLPIPVDSTALHPEAMDSTETGEKLYEDDATRRIRIKRELTEKELEKLKNDRMERDRLLETLRKKIEGNDAESNPKKSNPKARKEE